VTGARPVSQRPSQLTHIRDATRLVAMVHELHKAGRQRIRIWPGMAPNGIHWRCPVTYAGNMEADGLGIADFDVQSGKVAPYTSGQEAKYFGWEDGPRMTARMLAARFIERFPLIAREGEGRDFAYAGWLTDLLGRMEQGAVGDAPIFYADYDLDNEWLRDWRPPPPS
jgi:hypothetical protein